MKRRKQMAKPSLRNLRKQIDDNIDVIEPMRTVEKSLPVNTKKMSLYVSPATWRALNLRKLDTERSVNEIINEAIAEYLSKSS
jgi:predicted HicB family RNase H-like nuclease